VGICLAGHAAAVAAAVAAVAGCRSLLVAAMVVDAPFPCRFLQGRVFAKDLLICEHCGGFCQR